MKFSFLFKTYFLHKETKENNSIFKNFRAARGLFHKEKEIENAAKN